MIRDFNIEWLAARKLILAQEFQTFVTGAGVATGVPVMAEINSSGITGAQINQAGDSIATIISLTDVDITKEIRFRALLSKNSTDADAETATLLYTPLVAGTTVLIAPATALSTAIPALTYGTVANVPTYTDFGKINRNTLSDTVFAISVDLAVSMTNASADEQFIVGLEMSYTPRRTAGPRRNILGGRRLVVTRPLGVQLHTSQEGL